MRSPHRTVYRMWHWNSQPFCTIFSTVFLDMADLHNLLYNTEMAPPDMPRKEWNTQFHTEYIYSELSDSVEYS